MLTSFTQHSSSYRDPSGFIFTKDNITYRQVNQVFKEHFDLFFSSGCYEKLVKQKLLIPHEKLNENLTGSNDWYTTLKPEQIEFISYPWEWSFDMLKDAALLTLHITKEAISSGMILKDATPYNIQWHKGRLIFIDTLSFEKYNPDEPWIAYRQFCENFLAPLLLMHYRKQPLQQLSLAWPEGIPLSVTKSLLPWRSKLSLHTYLHIHLHASVSERKKDKANSAKAFSKQKMLNLITSFKILIKKLNLPDQPTTWSEYYDEASQRSDYLEQKKKIITQWIDEIPGIRSAADLGANDGEFSRILAAKRAKTIAADLDPFCINGLYNKIKISKEGNIQPIVADFSYPSPAVGFNNNERSSLISRLHVDLSLALALIHHLAIGKNIPLHMIADFLKNISKTLIIEFVPKTDEKVRMMLSGKKDIYVSYTQKNFEEVFRQCFRIDRIQPIAESGRILYLMR